MKDFYINKQDNEGNEKRPNRRISAKVGEEFKDIGVGWVKQDKNGVPFISCKLKETYETPDGKVYDGFMIISEAEYKHLKACEKRASHLTSPTEQFPNGIDMAKHPLNSPKEQEDYDQQLADI